MRTRVKDMTVLMYTAPALEVYRLRVKFLALFCDRFYLEKRLRRVVWCAKKQY